jgi:hypothetical protein
MPDTSAIHYLPIVTTLVAAIFATIVFRRYNERGGTHLLWWGLGMVTYGAGTVTESLTTLMGWHESIFRAWYITGALLGGAPLAQGTAYLLFPRRIANATAVLLVTAIGVASVAVLVTQVDPTLAEGHRLSGAVFLDQRVRLFSPFINSYAAIVLIGGAILSAVRYARVAGQRHRMWANVAIATGGLLPGIGGASARFGHVEVLYVTELIGLLLIFVGYQMSTRGSTTA